MHLRVQVVDDDRITVLLAHACAARGWLIKAGNGWRAGGRNIRHYAGHRRAR
ncbi:hypothetical protein ACTMU2_28165 [Cupriavidus basilensis]